MSRPFRFSLSTVFLVLTCCALAIGWLSTVKRSKPALTTRKHPPTDVAIRKMPLTISASEVGRFATGYSWHLSVNSAGQADLTIDDRRKGRIRQFIVNDKQLNHLRELLIFHSFFSMDDEYGKIVPDGSTRTITITVGDFTKTVRIHYLMNWQIHDRPKLRDPVRTLHVWMLIRNWFHFPEAADTRRYDQMVVDSLKSGKSQP